MKLAILSPIAWRTPPENYGPWEQVASTVAEGMVKQGVDVTVFATGNSLTSGKLVAAIERPYGDDPDADAKVNECLHISNLMERADEFDIIHNHYDFLPLTYSRLIRTPMLTTIHGFSSARIVPVYQKYNSTSHYVSISNADRNPLLEYMATVYNGINMTQFDFNPERGNYLLYFGRIHPDKGTLEAIQVALQTGKDLVIAGLIQDHSYWNEKIKPLVDGKRIRYIGNCGPAERNKVLGNARALLHLVNFDEPFGLSVAESMCCGTPVIANRRGAMPELIADGQTGFLVNSTDGAIEAVARVDDIERHACRKRVAEHFSSDKMTGDYLRLYEKLLERKTVRENNC